MTAIILAAGRARQPASPAGDAHSPVPSVGGRPVVAWMLDHLRAVGASRAVVVVGPGAEPVPAIVTRARRGLPVRYVDDPGEAHGSAQSLYRARDAFRGEVTLIMDAALVFPREALRRLVEARAPNALLCDRGGRARTGEPRVYTRTNRVVALARDVVPMSWDTVGANVGIWKCGASVGRDLVALLEELISDGGAPDYEDAVHRLVGARLFRAVDVAGLPWTRVQSEHDLLRAEQVVFPMIQELDGAA